MTGFETGDRERVPAGHDQFVAGRPGGEERGQVRVGQPVLGVQGVLGVVEDEQERRVAGADRVQPSPPVLARLGEGDEPSPQRVVRGRSGASALHLAAQLVEDPVDGGVAVRRHDDATGVAEPPREFRGETGLADPADPVDEHPKLPPGEPAQDLPAAHEVRGCAHHAVPDERLAGRRGDGSAAPSAGQPQPGIGQEQRRHPPLGGGRGQLPAYGGDLRQQLRLAVGGQPLVEPSAELDGVPVADRPVHRQHRRRAVGQQRAGQPGQLPLILAGGGAAGQHDQRNGPAGRQHLGQEPRGIHAVLRPGGGLQQQRAGPRVTGDVQDVERLLGEGGPDRRGTAPLQDAHPHPVPMSRFHRAEDPPEFPLVVQQRLGRVIRARDRREHPQWAVHPDRGCRCVGAGPADVDVGVQRQRQFLAGQHQGLPGQVGQGRVDDLDAEPVPAGAGQFSAQGRAGCVEEAAAERDADLVRQLHRGAAAQPPEQVGGALIGWAHRVSVPVVPDGQDHVGRADGQPDHEGSLRTPRRRGGLPD
ncbi:hypothetical protein PSN01_05970 [Micromonospora saelicesensis]|nr:hypothetical protein PSN01_05970 [Micromonospora saelicesensis]